MDKLEFFDCEVSFGIPGFKRETTPITKGEILAKFDRYGIDNALIRYEYAATGIHRIGNMELIAQIKDTPRLFPVWVVVPHYTGEFHNPDELVKQMKEHGVRALSLQASNWTVGEWTCGELFRMMELHKIPLILPINRLANGFTSLYEILCNHKNLRIILTSFGYTALRDLYPLLEMFPNLYLCTSTLKTQMGIEEIATKFGANRMIFGSGMPALSGAASVALITYAKLEHSQKQMIAADNLKKLMQEVEF